MDIFAEAFMIIAVLGSLVEQFKGINDPKFSGEYLGSSVVNIVGDAGAVTGTIARRLYMKYGLIPSFETRLIEEKSWMQSDAANRRGERRWRMRDQKALLSGYDDATKKTARKIDNVMAASPILAAIAVVEAFEQTAGFGPPYDGADLEAGSAKYAQLQKRLKSTSPDPNKWDGPAGKAYTQQNAGLLDLADTMAERDGKLAEIVNSQAASVTHVRLALGITKALLDIALFVELRMYIKADFDSLAAAPIFASRAAILGGSAAPAMVTVLGSISAANARKVRALTAEYSEAAAGLGASRTLAPTRIAAAAESRVSSSDAIARRMSGSLTMSEAMRVAGGAGDDGPAQPETAATPVLTIPTSAQVTATSEQAAGLSGNIPQRADLLNQKMGQIQQVASMTQRDKAPRTETAALTDDVDDADAGASGRKPVEFAVAVAEQLQKPSTRVSVG